MRPSAPTVSTWIWALLAFWLVGILNHSIGSFGFSLHLQVLMVIFVGIHMPDFSPFPLVVVLALMEAGARGLSPGPMLLAYGALWLFCIWSRRRIHRTHPTHLSLTAVGGQVLFVVLLTPFVAGDQLTSFPFITSLTAELLLSLGVIYLMTPAWCRFQKRVLWSLGWNPDAQLNKL